MESALPSKERVRRLLVSKQGMYVSGELIAQELQLSRNAVWKAINALRKSGYEIDAVTNRGYCMTGERDEISETGIKKWLADPERVRLHIYSELRSTNFTAKEMALDGAPHGTVLIAARQSEGAGRARARFDSPEGGLYMSVILRPEETGEPVQPDLYYARLAAVAVCEAIEQVCEISTCIREVDDLYLNENKICGILTESGSEIESGMVHWFVVGIGIRFRRIYGGRQPRSDANQGAAVQPRSDAKQGTAEQSRGDVKGAAVQPRGDVKGAAVQLRSDAKQGAAEQTCTGRVASKPEQTGYLYQGHAPVTRNQLAAAIITRLLQPHQEPDQLEERYRLHYEE